MVPGQITIRSKSGNKEWFNICLYNDINSNIINRSLISQSINYQVDNNPWETFSVPYNSYLTRKVVYGYQVTLSNYKQFIDQNNFAYNEVDNNYGKFSISGNEKYDIFGDIFMNNLTGIEINELDDMTAQELLTEIESLRDEILNIKNSLNSYVNVNTINLYATKEYIDSQHYLTEHQSLAGYITQDILSDNSYITQNSLSNNSYITQQSLSANSYITQNSLSNNSYITQQSLSANSYLTTNALNNCGYITINDIPKVDLSSYITKDVLSNCGYITADDVVGNDVNLSDYVTKDNLSQCGYITINDVPQIQMPDINLSDYITQDTLSECGYITINDVPQIQMPDINLSDYITQDTLSECGYITANDIPQIDIPTVVNNIETIKEDVEMISTSSVKINNINDIIDRKMSNKDIVFNNVDNLDTQVVSNYINSNNYYAVDLGLTSGTKWGIYNLGANTETSLGDYYSWGSTQPYYNKDYAQSINASWETGKEDGYVLENNPYWDNNLRQYSKYFIWEKTQGNYSLQESDDPAHLICGTNWHIPTKEQIKELINQCQWIYDEDKYAFKVIGPNGNFIYLPFTSYRHEKKLDTQPGCLYYLSNELYDYDGESVNDVNYAGISGLYYCEHGIDSKIIANETGIIKYGEPGYTFSDGYWEYTWTDGSINKIWKGNAVDMMNYITEETKNDNYNIGDIIELVELDKDSNPTGISKKYICEDFLYEYYYDDEDIDHINRLSRKSGYNWKEYIREELQIGYLERRFGYQIRPVFDGVGDSNVGDLPVQTVLNVNYPSNILQLNVSELQWWNNKSNTGGWTDNTITVKYTADQLQNKFGLTKRDILYLSLGIYNCIKFNTGNLLYVRCVYGGFINYDGMIIFQECSWRIKNMVDDITPEVRELKCTICNTWDRDNNREVFSISLT